MDAPDQLWYLRPCERKSGVSLKAWENLELATGFKWRTDRPLITQMVMWECGQNYKIEDVWHSYVYARLVAWCVAAHASIISDTWFKQPHLAFSIVIINFEYESTPFFCLTEFALSLLSCSSCSHVWEVTAPRKATITACACGCSFRPSQCLTICSCFCPLEWFLI